MNYEFNFYLFIYLRQKIFDARYSLELYRNSYAAEKI